ncbi:MAG: hypothetical protein QNI95_12105 [Desulfobacterales bacterium]|nr:hypothetical protein [Desulfobacterales bacterium]
MASPTKKLFVIGNYRISCAGCEERTGIVALKQLIKLYVINCKGSVEWQHEDPQHLIVRDAIGSSQIIAQGQSNLCLDANRNARLGLDHPEGFFVSFANLYLEIANAIAAQRNGKAIQAPQSGFPTVSDGVIGVRFVDAVTRSHENSGTWTDAFIHS